jgi:tellurite resistance protein TerB
VKKVSTARNEARPCLLSPIIRSGAASVDLVFSDKLRSELERYRNKDFLKAVLAVCALTSCADPTTSLATRYRVETVLDRLDTVCHYGRDKASAILDEYTDALQNDFDRAADILHGKVRRFAGDYKRLRTLLRVAYMIIVADGTITPAEQAEFDRLCRVLSIEPGALIGGLLPGPPERAEA